jgi:hypothetical protein
MGENTAGYFKRKHLLDSFQSSFRGDLVQVSDLSAPEKLDALPGKRIVKSRQGESGTVQVRNGNIPNETSPAADAPEIKRIVFL